MNLGERLYSLRKSKGLSQEKVAESLGVSRQTISKWETNQTTPDFDKIVPLCRLYEITTDELLTGEKTDDCKNNDYYNSTFEERANHETQKTQADNYYYENQYNYQEQVHEKNLTELKLKQKKRYALLLSISIFLYILSPVPFFFSENASYQLILTIFFVIIAIATMIIVFASVSKNRSKDKKDAPKTKDEKLLKDITHILSLIVLVIYLAVSFSSKNWGITWIIWVVYGLICEIIKLIFSLKGAEKNEK
ncbi:MAG: helix-turn-helix domain-containing protein [Acetobacter sp.]|nr:helix-turn-helix domain-containing protein [Bacteroides sp.]MCM1341284.1 helix-turn-helix domain-containing protein [Acetobacter sp.]MCM1433940.1 helix-turn-helix domain-containing protein [Clostridiales bacterium]